MSIDDVAARTPSYNDRIAVLPGEPRVAYRPGVVIGKGRAALEALKELHPGDAEPIFEGLDDDEKELELWFKAEGVEDAPGVVGKLVGKGHTSHLDIVYFANAACCGTCPPHPAAAVAIAANPWAANPWAANPWAANPWAANPWAANPWAANPWAANAEALNLVATGKPPMSSAMPAPDRALPLRQRCGSVDVVIGVLDSGLAGAVDDGAGGKIQLRPNLLGLDQASLDRISGELDIPSVPIGGFNDHYLDPVAGHGTFIAGIIEQLTPGCTIKVQKVFYPEGDVSVLRLAVSLYWLWKKEHPSIVNFSFGGTGRAGLFEEVITHLHTKHDVVFVGSAGNEGTCIEQYPANLPEVVGVAALGPMGPAPWSNYGSWVDASAPGTDLVSSFFASFDGALPPINGLDPDDFEQWATWSGTSFAGPVVVAALAREMTTTGCHATEAVQRVVRAPHLARFPNMGTIVNY